MSFTVIKCLRSTTPGAEPQIGGLQEGQIAVNIADGKIWVGNASNNPVLLGGLQDGSGLPTSDPLVAGDLWNDNGTVKVSNG